MIYRYLGVVKRYLGVVERYLGVVTFKKLFSSPCPATDTGFFPFYGIPNRYINRYINCAKVHSCQMAFAEDKDNENRNDFPQEENPSSILIVERNLVVFSYDITEFNALKRC